MTKHKRGKEVKSSCKGRILMISHGVKVCGRRTEGCQAGEGQCTNGRVSGQKDLIGSKNYMGRGSRG